MIEALSNMLGGFRTDIKRDMDALSRDMDALSRKVEQDISSLRRDVKQGMDRFNVELKKNTADKEYLQNIVTTGALKSLAENDNFKGMAQQTLKGLAMKDDLKGLATKEDLEPVNEKLDHLTQT